MGTIIKPKVRFSSLEYINKVLQLYSQASLVIGMKLHSIVTVAAFKVHSYLRYRPKF